MIWLIAAACMGPSYDQVSRIDTIEAYEEFLEADPDSAFKAPVEQRLEELYFDKAQKEDTLAAWEAYTSRFSTGAPHYPQALKRAAQLAWREALADGSPEALRSYLEQYSKGDQVLADRAKGMLGALEYGKLELSAPRVEPVNLAEDPKGEKNGWGVFVDVTNAGAATLPYVRLSVEWQKSDGTELATKDYPLVSDHWNLPATEEQQTPIKPGEKRTWAWTEDYSVVPAGQPPAARVYPSGFRKAE